MEIYHVGNVEEAVALANKLKAEGQYDWFRGQVRDWPPHSSLIRHRARKDDAVEYDAEHRLDLFCNWVNSIPELQYLMQPKHVHDLFAIMQHYGIPTHYIDFTTDPAVAGFFAADTATPPTAANACIYCLNTEDLMSLWDVFKEGRQGTTIELVTISVTNLWRLEAQKGVFLFADYNWDIDYPMDRILFPYSGYPSFPTRARMYPEHKSPLEQLLDQYFSIEAATFTAAKVRRLIDEFRKRGGTGSYTDWNVWKEGFSPEAFPDATRLRDFRSWNPDALRPWQTNAEERFEHTVGSTMQLQLKPNASAADVKSSVEFGIREILRSDPTIRLRAVDWVFKDPPDRLPITQLNDAIRAVWNGVRRLPYTDAEISEALGSVAALCMLSKSVDPLNELLGEGMRVGFSSSDGSGSVGWISLGSLRRAMRADLPDLVGPEHRELARDVRKVFKIIYNPRLLFDFNEFKGAFAREVIPAQALMQRSPILYNPAQLWIFGIP